MLLELDAAYMDGRVDLVGGAGGMVMVLIRRLCFDGGDVDQED